MSRPRPNTGRRVAPRGGRALREPRVIRVHTEGRVTEPDYLSHWERLNDGVRIDWGASGMVPMSLVRHAREDAGLSRRASKRHSSPDYDEIWCVFDVDAHPNVKQAISEAQQSGIQVAVSNPCFELWLVLHCQDQAASIQSSDIQRDAKKLNLIRGKAIPASAWKTLTDNYDDAKRRARDLDQMHRGVSPPRSNPSTDVWRLVDRLRS